MEAAHENSELALQSISLTDPASDSALELYGSISFDESIFWDLNVTSTGISIPAPGNFPGGRLQGSLVARGQAEAEAWRAEFDAVALQGQIGKSPARISGKVTLDDRLQISNSDLKVMANGAGLSVLARGNIPPQIELEVEDLGLWLSDSRGSLRLSSTLVDSQRRIVFQGSGLDLLWRGVSVPSGRVTGSYRLIGERDFDLSVDAGNLRYEDWQLSKIELALRGDKNAQNLKLVAAGDLETSLLFSGQFAGSAWSGQLMPASLATPLGEWQLNEPVELRWADAATGFTVAAHCWRQSSARLCVGDSALGEQGRASVDLEGDLQIFSRVIPEDVKLAGDFAVSINTHWEPGTVLGAEGIARFSRGSFARISGEEKATLDWDKASLTGKVVNGGMHVEGELWRDNSNQMTMVLGLPGGKEQAMKGHVSFVDFSLSGILKPFFPMFSDHRGSVNGTMELSGTVASPLLHGEVALVDGQISLVGNPTSMENLNLSIRATGDRAELSGGVVIGGGDTGLAGSMLLHPEPRLELRVDGERQTLLLPPGIEATVSESLNIVVLNSQLELKGEITVHEGILAHEQLPAGSVDVSPDVVEVDYEGAVVSNEGPFDFAADVQLNILDSFQVEGTNLTTTVGGALDLRKEPSEPLQIFGELNTIDGKIEAFGQLLSIKRGNVSFVGEPDNPDLNLRAERDIAEEKIKITVEVLGPLDEFTFRVSSVPTMSEAQAMSYLIRGRGLDEGAEADGAAMALSLGLGAVNRTGAVEGINKLPGLSKVSFGTEGEAADTTATVSGYVGERLYLAYGVGVYEPINVLTTRLYLQTQLWLEVVSSLESSVDLYYSFDIK